MEIITIINANDDHLFYATGTFQLVIGDPFVPVIGDVKEIPGGGSSQS